MLTKPLISPHDLKNHLPIPSSSLNFVLQTRAEIKKILHDNDPRLLLIIGPCSIHDIQATLEYAQKLKALAESISDSLFIVMRVYFEKPRSLLGWKGFMYDPYLNGSDDIANGVFQTRQLLLKLAEMQIPVASEFLDPLSPAYFEELISWGCIGARTSSSQIHRQMASNLPFPTGFKNNTDGNIDVAISGVLAAATSHTHLGVNDEGVVSIVKTKANSDCHIVLRGSDQGSNYDPQSISLALEKLILNGLPPRLIVDCAHGNSFRLHENQPIVFQSLIHQIKEGNNSIRGILLESHLFEGKQSLESQEPLKYGISITDSCIGWTTTESLVKWAYAFLKNNHTAAKPIMSEQYATNS